MKGWKQRTKVNSSYSVFAEFFFGVPWGTTLGPLLSAFTSLTSFFKKVTLILLIMLMAMHRMPVYQTLIISLLNFRKTQEGFLDGFKTKTQYQTLKTSQFSLESLVRSKENWEVQVSSCSIRNEDSAKVLGIHINNVLNFLLSCQSTMPEGK